MVLTLATAAVQLLATETNQSHNLILLDPLGKAVIVSTNDMPASLLPPPKMGLHSQLPSPTRGESLPDPMVLRQELSQGQYRPFRFFPSYEPRLMPYLAGQDIAGNTALKPGPLFPSSPLDVAAQQAKYRLSEIGFTYSLQQTLTWVSMTDVMQGNNTIGYYTLSWKMQWLVLDAPAAGSAGWLTAKINAQTGLGAAGDTQSAARNLGTVADPTGIWSSVDGFRIPQLAWQQSLADGRFVAIAGMVDQSHYLDANSYANSGRGQFLNSALINSMVVPLKAYNFGINLQWQPLEEWYGMIGASAGNAHAGVAPWTDFNWQNWSTTVELGYAPRNFLSLGPGVYRVQPFVGQPDSGSTARGLGLNFQQQLGPNAPFAWFGRYGHGGTARFQTEASQDDTGDQLGTGFVMRGPLEYAGLFPSRAHDALGLAFIWSHPSSKEQPLYHRDEYGVELGYALQLTPTTKLQPDLQVVWNRAHNPDSSPAAVFQLQLDFAW